ncbi:hypothetical protein BH09PSE4_BH09PSE4_20700 [soil metagenome]
MKNSICSTIVASFALCLATIPAPAMAAGFTPEGQQHWLEVARALTVAANSEAEDMDAPCKGVTIMGGGSEIRHESALVPKWAVMAHFQTCIAFHIVAKGGKGFMHMNSGDACKGIKAAVGELGKAKPGVDPDDVVAAAGKLKGALTSLAADFKDAKACRFG